MGRRQLNFRTSDTFSQLQAFGDGVQLQYEDTTPHPGMGSQARLGKRSYLASHPTPYEPITPFSARSPMKQQLLKEIDQSPTPLYGLQTPLTDRRSNKK